MFDKSVAERLGGCAGLPSAPRNSGQMGALGLSLGFLGVPLLTPPQHPAGFLFSQPHITSSL